MRSLVLGTAVVLLLLVGSTRLPPAFLDGISDSITDACGPLIPGRLASNERNAQAILRMLASAQADFRANDRDRDGVNQFWRGDVAGLYGIAPPGGPPIRLIPQDIAAADERPLAKFSLGILARPYCGYWFRALRHADEDPKALDPNRFAFCAIPVSPRSGKRIYVVDENNSLRSLLIEGPCAIDVFPTDNELRMKWGRPG